MKKIVFALIMITGITCFVIACSRREEVPTVETKVYFVDSEMNRLLPYSENIIDADAEHQVSAVVDKLIAGHDDNDKIRRLLPDKRSCISTSVIDNIAYVDLSSEIARELPCSRDIEKLVIYQIVDSVAGVKGIRFVKFTVDGEVKQDFMGFYDMRNTYKYVYPE
ncbi:MAG: GerMN domain-containing protein [Clostridiales bacterium]|nr:GerMN domain-containing protein [Clostridiales bacterium]